MQILKFECFNEEALIKKLRCVTMLEERNMKPYKNSFISLEKISTEDLFPSQRYVLKDELLKIRRLKWALEEKGLDLFGLNGFVRLTIEGFSEKIDLLPPVIEESIEKNGRIVHIINDGMHRIYTAYLEWLVPQVIFIRGIPKNLPYYSFPIPERDWTKIDVLEDIPSGFIKKWHRIDQNKMLYRNFNSAFLNVGGPRGRTKKLH